MRLSQASSPDAGRPPRGSIRYRLGYAVFGVVLGTGAPLGGLAIRLATGTVQLGAEVRAHLFYYAYELAGTSLVFGVAGFFAGLRADRLRAGRDRFRRLAARDDLTGLPNRRVFREHYSRVVARSHRYGEPVSLLLVDVDGLKEINDRWGHMAGNAALVHVSRLLREQKRAEDLAARWGGDEFVLLLPGAGEDAAERVAGAILRTARKSALKSPPIAITVTIGVATGIPSSPTHDFFEAADAALYEGKKEGRNRFRLRRIGLSPISHPEGGSGS